MIKLPTTIPLIISDYYDSLINRLDIYTEELIKNVQDQEKHTKTEILFKDYLSKLETENEKDAMKRENPDNQFLTLENLETPGEAINTKIKNDPYSEKYTYDETCNSSAVTLTKYRTQIDYFNGVRCNAIGELTKAKQENLRDYELNRIIYKRDLSKLDAHDIDLLPSQLFKKKFCFILEIEAFASTRFKMITFVCDFYLSQNELEQLRLIQSFLFVLTHGLSFNAIYLFPYISFIEIS